MSPIEKMPAKDAEQVLGITRKELRDLYLTGKFTFLATVNGVLCVYRSDVERFWHERNRGAARDDAE